QLRSTEQLRLVEGELCGAAGADCVTPLVSITLGDRASSWYPEAHQRLLLGEPEGGCANALALLEQANLNGELASKQLMRDAMDCALRGRLQQFLAQPALVAQPVLAQLDAELSTVPLFDAYEGGELQAKYVEQFRALRSPAEWLKSLITSTDAMKAQVDSAHRQLRNANKAVKRHCGSSQTLATAATIISTVPGAVGSASGAGAAAAGPVGAAVAGLTAGGAAVYLAWKQNSDACANAKDAVRAAKVSAIAAMMDAQAGAVAAAVGLTDRQAEIVQSGVALSSVAADARIARDRVLLEEKLETYGQRTSFGLYRQYREFDLWRAKALVESSRRFALAARRAVEARFVVDLSEMTAAEPFVSAPATWADEIYEYDLSLPAAVGLTVGATPAAGTYASKIVDYVGNLDAFVTGYSVGRPTAVAQGDVDVLYLPGTADGTPEDFDPDLDPPAVYYPEAGSWLVQCPPTTPGGEPVWTAALAPGAGGVAGTCTDWQSAGCVACVDRDVDCAQEAGCYEPPLRVRIAVALDPWGRLVGDAGSDDLERRHNARWTQLAVNLVGSGVRDCARARDTLACYSQGFVRYSLSHVGPSTVTDFEQRWTALAVPIGRIEGGKALASETVLNPLRDGWQTSYVAPIARTEFADRPMGGAYLLEIVAGPEVRLDRVERIQILAGQSYWVRQD
ncbi:MAG: hypothetical protein FJ104_07265, partial [Deltaproteobacteria bacterium]|nr:hypothetical protein [Deltaproteobacteria bacterium]